MVDISSVVAQAVDDLASESAASLIHWTEAELYLIANEHAARAARKASLMVTRRSVPSAAVMALAPRHVTVLNVSHGSQSLEPATIRELEARRADWRTVTDWLVTNYVLDADGHGNVRVWPGPLDTQQINLVERVGPPAATTGAPQVDLPPIMADVLEWAVLAEARGRDGRGRMPEVQRTAIDVLAALEAALVEIYGQSQAT